MWHSNFLKHFHVEIVFSKHELGFLINPIGIFTNFPHTPKPHASPPRFQIHHAMELLFLLSPVCATESISDSILGFWNSNCHLYDDVGLGSLGSEAVTEVTFLFLFLIYSNGYA